MAAKRDSAAAAGSSGPELRTPPKPNRGPEVVPWKRRLERFTIASDSGDEMVHEGVGLTLDQVLGWEVNPDVETRLGCDSDEVVWHRGRVVAIIRHLDGRRPVVRRIDPERAPFGEGDDDAQA